MPIKYCKTEYFRISVQTVRNGVDVVVGTPGRVLDLMERRVLNLSGIEHVVLDEVDQMLDMGFSDDVDQIIKDCYTVGMCQFVQIS